MAGHTVPVLAALVAGPEAYSVESSYNKAVHMASVPEELDSMSAGRKGPAPEESVGPEVLQAVPDSTVLGADSTVDRNTEIRHFGFGILCFDLTSIFLLIGYSFIGLTNFDIRIRLLFSSELFDVLYEIQIVSNLSSEAKSKISSLL